MPGLSMLILMLYSPKGYMWKFEYCLTDIDEIQTQIEGLFVLWSPFIKLSEKLII